MCAKLTVQYEVIIDADKLSLCEVSLFASNYTKTMAKRKCSTDELREILEQSDDSLEEYMGFSSGDSVKDPGWNHSDSSHDEHIEIVLRDMQQVEEREDAKEVEDSGDANEIIQGESEINQKGFL